jgi:hypothetical protein
MVESPVVGDFMRTGRLDTLPALLLRVDLAWVWESWRQLTVGSDSPVIGLPEDRPLTRLDERTAPLLVGDLHERNADGDGRDLTLYGLDPGAIASLPDLCRLGHLLNLFVWRARGPLEFVLYQEDDAPHDVVFIKPEPAPAVAALLTQLGLDLATFTPPRRGFGLSPLPRESRFTTGGTVRREARLRIRVELSTAATIAQPMRGWVQFVGDPEPGCGAILFPPEPRHFWTRSLRGVAAELIEPAAVSIPINPGSAFAFDARDGTRHEGVVVEVGFMYTSKDVRPTDPPA